MKSYYISNIIMIALSIILALFVYTDILNPYLSFLPLIPIIIVIAQGILNHQSQRYQELNVKDQNETLEDISESLDKKFDELDKVLEQRELLSKFEARQKIVAKLLDNSFLEQKTIYKLMMPREFYFIFCYEADIDKALKEKYCKNRQPILPIIEKIGFIKIGWRFNLYFIVPETLDPKFRDIEFIRKYIMRTFKKESDYIAKNVKKDNKPLYERMKSKEKHHILNYTFLISKAKLEDLFISYHPFNSFSPDFQNYLNGVVDFKKLRKETQDNKHKIKKFISSISHEFLLDNISDTYKDIIIRNKKVLKEKLGVKKFTDYADVPTSLLERELLLIFTNKEKAKYCANLIRKNAQEYRDALNEMGIIL